jgi:Exo-beta-D-glucosaminidase Ig-fold domain
MSRNHRDTEKSWIVSVTNNSDKLAFFIRPQIMDCGEEVLPSDWSANYFSLAPGETISVTVTVPAVQLKSAEPELKISGWNVDEQRIALN